MAAQRPSAIRRPPGDDGRPARHVTTALSAWQQSHGSEGDALAALSSARLLVPVVAMLTEADEQTGGEKESEMALPTLIGNDGRTAIIAFTGLEPMRCWRPDARPVAAPAARIWHAAVVEGQSVVIDVAGPVPFVVEGARLAALAAGEIPPRPHEDPDVRAVIDSVVAATPGVTAYALAAPAAGGDLAVELRAAEAGPARDAAQAIAMRLAPRFRRGVEISAAV
jgi:hypothetical protein